MNNPLVACIIPAYNAASYVAEALASIFAQTYRPIEVVVVDDGSTDRTAEVLRTYPQPVQYYWQPNAGHAAARNHGIRISRGDFVAFLDADDRWHPEKLTRQMQRFQARPDLQYCVTCLQNFYDSATPSPDTSSLPRVDVKPLPGYSCGTLLARRTLFDRIGLLDESLQHADDTEWYVRANEKGVVGELLPDVLYYRRLHDSNRSHQLAPHSIGEYTRLLKTVLDRRRGRIVTHAAPSAGGEQV